MTDTIHRLLTVLMIIALTFTSSCVSTKDPVALRQKSYEKLVALIQPGMTRRQLYALLPPKEVPRASPQSLFPVDSRSNQNLHENHRLDWDFQVRVEYKLASHKELRLYESEVRTRMKEIDKAMATLKRKLKDNYNKHFGWGYLIVDVPSRQNLDDEIVEPPQIIRSSITPAGKSDEPQNHLVKVLQHATLFDEKLPAIINGDKCP